MEAPEPAGRRRRRLSGVAEAALHDVVEAFYKHLLAHDDTRAHLQSDKHIPTLKQVQSKYLLEMMDGQFDEASKQAADGLKETERAARSLSGLADEMDVLITRFSKDTAKKVTYKLA